MNAAASIVIAAAKLANEHLAAALPRRWRHVRGVAGQAAQLAAAIDLDATLLLSAAWLHDIGCAPTITATGFHPLDGARFLRRARWPPEVCALVAHHTRADVEAGERGLGVVLAEEFRDEPSVERDALWTADATIGPGGQPMTLEERVRDVEQRYGSEHLVTHCICRICPDLEAPITRTRARQRPAV